jgi:hypothetical protein
MSATSRRSMAWSVAILTATWWTESKARATWPISSVEVIPIGAVSDAGSGSASRSRRRRSTTPGSWRSATSLAAWRRTPRGRTIERAISTDRAMVRARTTAMIVVLVTAARSAATLPAWLTSATSEASRTATARSRSILALMTRNHCLWSTRGLGGRASGRIRRRRAAARAMSGSSSAWSSRRACWGVASPRNWASQVSSAPMIEASSLVAPGGKRSPASTAFRKPRSRLVYSTARDRATKVEMVPARALSLESAGIWVLTSISSVMTPL